MLGRGSNIRAHKDSSILTMAFPAVYHLLSLTLSSFNIHGYTCLSCCPIQVLGPYSVDFLLNGSAIVGSPINFEVLAGLPDVKTSRLVLPEPPLFSSETYDLLLISVDKYGNECTHGGAIVTGKLTGPNLPPGQETNVPVEDSDDGQYKLHLCLKAPADVKLIINVARDMGPGVLPDAGREFPHLSLKFESLKAFKAREEREALKVSSAPKAGEIKDGEGGTMQQRQQKKASVEQAGEATAELLKEAAPSNAPAAEDPGSANLAGLLGKAAKGGGKGNAKLKKAAKEMMEGFGVKEERRAKQVVGSAKQAAEMAVDAMQEKVSKARGRAAKKPMPIE